MTKTFCGTLCGRYYLSVWSHAVHNGEDRLWLTISDTGDPDWLKGKPSMFAVHGPLNTGWIAVVREALRAGEPPEMILDYCRDHGFEG